MADLSTLARPYAKAAFDYAKEQNSVGEWQQYLGAMRSIVTDKSFQAYLQNPAIQGASKIAALQDIYRQSVGVDNSEDKTVFSTMLAAIDSTHPVTQSSSGQLSVGFMNFLTQLSEQDRLALLPSIADRFELLKASDVQEVHAYITSAYPLTQSQELLIENRLKNMVGSNVILHVAIDPALMAGVTIKIGDKVIDDSVRGKLQQLKTQLTA